MIPRPTYRVLMPRRAADRRRYVRNATLSEQATRNLRRYLETEAIRNRMLATLIPNVYVMPMQERR